MPKIDLVINSKVSQTSRARSLEAMFDVPPSESQRLSWSIDAPIEDKDWSIGAILGPSGSGKSVIANHLWPDLLNKQWSWVGDSVIDDFDSQADIDSITKCCSAVGFNTIPAWLRPYDVLSNGEKFRVTLARMLLEMGDLSVMDEFTSVVDRQVAKIGCNAVQKYIRRNGKRFVAVSCHDDIVDWLQPDWVIRPGSQEFNWRLVQPRPQIDITIEPTDASHWKTFSKFHYLTNKIHRNARFTLLRVDGVPAVLAGWMHKPTNKASNSPKRTLVGLSRIVTLPDYQGLGLAFVLMDFLGGVFKRIGVNFHTYPAHVGLIQSFRRGHNWQLRKDTKMVSQEAGAYLSSGRPCATFRYVGEQQSGENAYKHFSGYSGNQWWFKLPKWKMLEATAA